MKLLTHELYRSYQSHTASLSLFANLFINFLPPAWGAPTPPTPPPPPSSAGEEEREKAARLEHSNELYRRELERAAVPVSETSVRYARRPARH